MDHQITLILTQAQHTATHRRSIESVRGYFTSPSGFVFAGSTDRQNWRLLDGAQHCEDVCADSDSLPAGVRRFPIVVKRTIAHEVVWFGCSSAPRPDATRVFAHISKTTRSISVIDHSKESLFNGQDACHSHFLNTARMRISIPLERMCSRCHGVASRHASLSMWHVTIPKYRTFLDWSRSKEEPENVDSSFMDRRT